MWTTTFSNANASTNTATHQWSYVHVCDRECLVEHPLRVRVIRFDDWQADIDECKWHWSVWRYEDRHGQRSHVSLRWGAATRWEDALWAALCAWQHQQDEETS